jgi:hypothetical protein
MAICHRDPYERLVDVTSAHECSQPAEPMADLVARLLDLLDQLTAGTAQGGVLRLSAERHHDRPDRGQRRRAGNRGEKLLERG